jgi:hypothetical protein
LPSQNYSTAGEALKELVDNAWDADAEEVGRTSKKRPPIKGREEVGKFAGVMSAVGVTLAALPVAKSRKKITCRRTGDFSGFSNR